MIVTKHFVYIHTSRTAGTFLNKLILEHVPGARKIQYHGHLSDLPAEFSHLPVIGFVRNPWDWYVSMFSDYRRKQQYIYKIVSDGGVLEFTETVARFLRLGDRSVLSKRLLTQLSNQAPTLINAQTPPRRGNPGLTSEHFANYPADIGYYSWLFKLMYESKIEHRVHIGRFENLREETQRLFELTGTPVTDGISSYLKEAEALNQGPRPKDHVGGYPPQLELLVGDKEKYLIDRFGYEFLEAGQWSRYPKTDFFRDLGLTDVSALLERVKKIPESLWVSDYEGKPKKNAELNDTCHIMFRFVDEYDNAFDSRDYAIWDEWKDLLTPIMEQAARKLGYENYHFPRVMLAKIPAGGEISPHSDRRASHYVHKIHVPLITNPETIFHVGIQARNLPVGEIVEINNKRNHAVTNHGEFDRIHFIFECYNLDDYGKSS